MINKVNKKETKIKTIFICNWQGVTRVLKRGGYRRGYLGVSSRKKAFHFFAQQTVTTTGALRRDTFWFRFRVWTPVVVVIVVVVTRS